MRMQPVIVVGAVMLGLTGLMLWSCGTPRAEASASAVQALPPRTPPALGASVAPAAAPVSAAPAFAAPASAAAAPALRCWCPGEGHSSSKGSAEKSLEARAEAGVMMSLPAPKTERMQPLAGGRPIGDRDLGKGKDNEKLGCPRVDIDPDEESSMPMDPWTGERYPIMTEAPFVAVASPGGDASTFGLDVDTASWSLVRRYLSHGRLPPVGAIRSEELINAVTYHYPAPEATSDHPLRVTASVAVCPWNTAHRLVRMAVKGKVLDRATRPALNLVFLVDTSGSMAGEDRLPLVKRGLEALIPQLDERDHVAIVTYAGASFTPLSAVRGDQHDVIRGSLQALAAGGGTNGAGGIQAAYAEAAKHVAPGVQSRVILCTDGDFNVGVTSDAALVELIERQRSSGIFLSVYGFGLGNLRDAMMQQLADHGNGAYGIINTERDVQRLLVDGAMGQLVTIAKDAKVQVFFNPAQVAGWRQIGYEKRQLHREDFNDDTKDAGDIGAGHTVTVLYEVVPVGVPVPAASDPNPYIAPQATPYQQVVPTQEGAGDLLQMRLRWKPADGSASRLEEQRVAATVVPMDQDFQTAAALAGLAMQLRQSPWKGTLTWDQVASLAKAGMTHDPQRHELVRLVAAAQGLSR